MLIIYLTLAIKSSFQENSKQQLKFSSQVVTLSTNLIVLPKVFLTNNAPDLAKKLAPNINNILLELFQIRANQYKFAPQIRNKLNIGGKPSKLTKIASFISRITASSLTIKGEKLF